MPRQSVASQRQLPAQQNAQTPPGQMSGMDTGTNVNSMMDKSDKDALVIKGKPKELELVKRMLAEVDRPIAEMLVKAVVMEVQTGRVEGSALKSGGRLQWWRGHKKRRYIQSRRDRGDMVGHQFRFKIQGNFSPPNPG